MRHFLLANLTVAALTLGCSSSDGPTGNDGDGGGGAATSIARVSGSGQRAAVGTSTLDPFVVRATDAQGRGVSGVSVTWTVTAGDGSLSQNSTTTGVDGETSVFLSVGDAAGENVVTASASPDGMLMGSPVTFTAVGVWPASLAITGGDGQGARISQPLAEALEVRVTASDNGPVPGATVMWSVTAGGGSLTAPSTTTDADGRTSVGLTLGTATGNNAVEAVGGGAMASFNATGSLPVSVTVQMLNIAFQAPGGGKDVTIMLGDTIRWENVEPQAIPHTATSTSEPPDGSSFDSGTLNPGQSFAFVPNTRGEWVYFCEIHPNTMRDARITVE